MASTLLDLIPVFVRTEADIRASVNTTANLGLTPDDARWRDTREGSLFWICTQPFVIELARLYDRSGSEVAAASNIATAWGDWLDRHAASYGLVRKPESYATGIITITGDEGTLLPIDLRVGAPQTDPDIDPPIFGTTASGVIDSSGTIDLPIQAILPGPDGNVSSASLTVLLTTPTAGVIAAVTNAGPTGGGADPESDEDLRARLQLEFMGKGSGTQTDYKRWSLTEPGVGRVTVVPVASGPGTVLVVISDDDRQPVGTPTVDSLQARLDPDPGQGAGIAPIGHAVTVETTVEIDIDVVATVVPKAGYSVDGSVGTNIGPDIRDAVSTYLRQSDSGDDVVANHVRAVFFDVEGVFDVTALTINRGAGATTGNITLTALETAQLDDLTLS